jgi:hypothetical protein
MSKPDIVRVRRLVEELAALDFPRVWIGEVGITPEEYLVWDETNRNERRVIWEGMSPEKRKETLEEMPSELRERTPEEVLERPSEKWDDLPDRLQEAMRTPLEVELGALGFEYLDGLYVVENMRAEMAPHQYAELELEVGYIRAAKQGRVRI